MYTDRTRRINRESIERVEKILAKKSPLYDELHAAEMALDYAFNEIVAKDRKPVDSEDNGFNDKEKDIDKDETDVNKDGAKKGVNKKSNSSKAPKTGDAGLGQAISILAISALGYVASRKKESK